MQPNTVSEAEVCWPLGRKASATLPQTCLQRQSAWLLEGRDPPTLPDPMDWASPLRQVALTAEGKPTPDPLPGCGAIRLSGALAIVAGAVAGAR